MRFDTAGPLLRGIGPALAGLAELWPFWLMLLGFGVVAVLLTWFRHWYEERQYRASGLAEIDQMDPYRFEHYVAWLFQQVGFKTEVTKRSRDQGVDVLVTRGHQKIAVQAKRYSGGVGNEAVQQVAAGRPHYHCNEAIVVANQPFTPAARELANSNGVQLWDREVLAQVIKAIREGRPEAVLARLTPKARSVAKKPHRPAPAKSEQPATPNCPRCAGSMELRKVHNRPVWMCAKFPACTGSRMVDGR